MSNYFCVCWEIKNKLECVCTIWSDQSLCQDYQRRAKVTATEQGLELTIAAARAGDAGRYKCSLTVGDTRQTLVQTVHIRGGALQESSSAKQLVVSEGDQMTLSCLTSSQAGDNPSVSWSKQVRDKTAQTVTEQYFTI